MKKLNLLLIAIILISFGACTPKVDIEAEKSSIATLLDNLHNASEARDVDAYLSFFDDEGIFCGTDPGEFWGKEALNESVIKMFADLSINTVFPVDLREIRLAEDGITAIAYEQYITTYISENIPIRSIYHFVKTDENWLIDFFSISLTPYNEDIGKINGAFE